MPCDDSSARITVGLDSIDCLTGYRYRKIQCGKEIGGDSGYERYSVGRAADEIVTLPFAEVADALEIADSDEQFLLHLEWDALRSALLHYMGRESDLGEPERHRVASIAHGPEGVEIVVVIAPPRKMPTIIACASRPA